MRFSVYMMDIRSFGWERKENKEKVEALIDSLSLQRQAKIQAFRTEKGRHLSLGAGLVLDRGLQAYGLREREVSMETGSYGKPYLTKYPEIHFNLSHSGTMVMAVFGDREVGCDVEQMAEAAGEKIAERFFTEQEKEALRFCGSKEQRRILFYRIWTRKESYIKLTGEGMHLPLNSFSVLPKEKTLACQFREFPTGDYQAAVCVPQGEESEPFFCSFQNLQDVV